MSMNQIKKGFRSDHGVGSIASTLDRFSDHLFGYDFFISYSHGDGLNYPRKLKGALEQAGLRVFLDQTDYVAGMDLRRETRRQVLKSTKLVIVAREHAIKSEWVAREVDVAVANGKVPVVLNINQTVQKSAGGSKLAILVDTNDWLRLEEQLEDADSGPSVEIIAELIRGFSHTRQNIKRLRTIFGALLLFAGTSALATWQAVEARRQRSEADQNFQIAKQAADSLVVNVVRGLKDVEGIRTEAVTKVLASAELAFDALGSRQLDDPSILRSRVAVYNEFVETYLLRGDTAQAKSAALKGVQFARAAVAKGLGQREDRRLLGLALIKKGDVFGETGDLEEAGRAYGLALETREKLEVDDPQDLVARRETTVALVRLADLASLLKDWSTAQGYLERSVKIRSELVKLKPEWRRDLGLNYLVLSDVLLEKRMLANASEMAKLAVSEFESLATLDDLSSKAKRDLAIGLQRLGNVELRSCNWESAELAFRRSEVLFTALSSVDQANVEWRRDVSVAHGKFADLYLAQGKPMAAITLLEKLVEERSALSRMSPAAAHLGTDLDEARADLARAKTESSQRKATTIPDPMNGRASCKG